MKNAQPFIPAINFWTNPDNFKAVWTNKQWREYILDAGTWTMACGQSYNWRSRPLGGGIREVWLVKR
jgi:hypothetical protein